MKNTIKLLAISILFLIPAGRILAQEEENGTGDYTLQTEIDSSTTKATNKYFDLILSEGIQSPVDKSITYKLTIIPHLTAEKTQILWDSSSTIKITPKHPEFVSVVDGEEYTYKAKIKPTVGGTYKINVSVIAWQYDTNYTNTVSNSLVLNNVLVSQPITPEYTILVVISILVILGVLGLVIWGGIEGSKLVLKRTKTWLTPPR